MRKALTYTGNHWQELTCYLDDASLPMDNNECEQLMKHTKVGDRHRSWETWAVWVSCFRDFH